LVTALPTDLTEEEAKEAVKALAEKRAREADAEWSRVVMARKLLHPSIWEHMCEADRNRFVAMDDEFSEAGPGKDKISLARLCNENEVLLPGHLKCAPSVIAYKRALTSMAQMARDVHVAASVQGSRIRTFIESIESNELIPDEVKDMVPDMLEALSNILDSADMSRAAPVVHCNNI
jgi:hypothetical protein